MKDDLQRKRWRVLELSERARDGQLAEGETAELEDLLRESPHWRRLFAEAMVQHAELRHDPSLLGDLEKSQVPGIRRGGVALIALAAAACFMIGCFLLLKRTAADTSPPAIATLVKATGCKWAASSLPTVEGSRVPAGTYELVEGLATLRFDSGAEVVLEAPVTLELIDAMACRLLRGTIMSDIPPSAIGFVVDTQTARVVDYGTRFGVSAGENGEYMVQVLEGRVEVEGTDEHHNIRAGETLDRGLLSQKLNPAKPKPGAAEPNRWQPDTIINDGDGWQILSTGYRRGKDAFIESGNTRNHGSEAFFRVKKTSIQPHLNRKGYIGLDLADFNGARFEDAELILSIERSDLGFATLVPDSTFAIYGLSDESQDDWGEHAVHWKNAPAHDPAGLQDHLPKSGESVFLGRIEIPQGVNHGTRTLRGQALVDFLNSDTNGQVTFIICRETDETARAGLVHAFATKENGGNTPPLLRLRPRR